MSEAPLFTCRRSVQDVRLRFDWWGGEYIEVHAENVAPQTPGGGELINVWNASAGAPRIARTREAFEAKCDEWVNEYGRESLVHDARENW